MNPVGFAVHPLWHKKCLPLICLSLKPRSLDQNSGLEFWGPIWLLEIMGNLEFQIQGKNLSGLPMWKQEEEEDLSLKNSHAIEQIPQLPGLGLKTFLSAQKQEMPNLGKTMNFSQIWEFSVLLCSSFNIFRMKYSLCKPRTNYLPHCSK
jgi:hypothetical protein